MLRRSRDDTAARRFFCEARMPIVEDYHSFVWAQTNPGGNVTVTSFPARPPSAVPPYQVPAGAGIAAQGDGVIALGLDNQGIAGSVTPRNLKLLPYGQGTPGSTFQMKVHGWLSTGGWSQVLQTTKLWVPAALGTFTCTLGSATGLVGTDLGPQYQFANSISQTYGPTNPSPDVLAD